MGSFTWWENHGQCTCVEQLRIGQLFHFSPWIHSNYISTCDLSIFRTGAWMFSFHAIKILFLMNMVAVSSSCYKCGILWLYTLVLVWQLSVLARISVEEGMKEPQVRKGLFLLSHLIPAKMPRRERISKACKQGFSQLQAYFSSSAHRHTNKS